MCPDSLSNLAKSLYCTLNLNTSSRPWTTYGINLLTPHLPTSAQGPHSTSLPCSQVAARLSSKIIKALMSPVESCTVPCSGLQLSTLQPQTFLVPQMHRSPSCALKTCVTSHPRKVRSISLPPPPAHTQNSSGNFFSLTRRHHLQNYTSDFAKAPHGTSEFSFQGLMTYKRMSTVTFTIWFFINPLLDET